MGTESKDIFSGIDPDNLQTVGGNNSDTQKTQPAKEPESASREFKPAQGGGNHSGEAMPIDPDDIFSFAEDKFKELSDGRPQHQPNAPKSERIIQTNDAEKTLQSTEVMSPEMIEVSAVMYVQILELVWSGVCQWWSGLTGDYNFEKKIKERYEKITAMYFEAQNIRLTPTHFFVLMTLLVLFAPAFKAVSDRKRRIRAESFGKKVDKRNKERGAGSQGVLFESDPVVKGRLYYAAEEYPNGEVWYTKDAVSGVYAKKGEREQVPPELESFILDFKKNNREWPTKKQVDIFLTQP